MEKSKIITNIPYFFENNEIFFEQSDRQKRKKTSLMLEFSFLLLLDSFLFFLICKFVFNKISHLKTLSLDLYSLIKLLFSTFLLSIAIIFFIDLVANFLNLMIINGIDKNSIKSRVAESEDNQGMRDEITIFNSGYIIFFDNILPFLSEQIQSFFSFIKDFFYKNIFKKIEEFAKNIVEYFKKSNDSISFSQKIKDFFNSFFDDMKKFVNFACKKIGDAFHVIKEFLFDFLEFIGDLVLKFILIPCAKLIKSGIDFAKNNFHSAIVPNSALKFRDSLQVFIKNNTLQGT
jgi:hypothetical protein